MADFLLRWPAIADSGGPHLIPRLTSFDLLFW